MTDSRFFPFSRFELQRLFLSIDVEDFLRVRVRVLVRLRVRVRDEVRDRVKDRIEARVTDSNACVPYCVLRTSLSLRKFPISASNLGKEKGGWVRVRVRVISNPNPNPNRSPITLFVT